MGAGNITVVALELGWNSEETYGWELNQKYARVHENA